MKASRKDYSRPERILLVVARHEGDCRGKAVRIADESEFRFNSLGELANWLADDSPPNEGTE